MLMGSLISIVCLVVSAFLLKRIIQLKKINKSLHQSLKDYQNQLSIINHNEKKLTTIFNEENISLNNKQEINYNIAIAKIAELVINCLDFDIIIQEIIEIVTDTLKGEFSQILQILPNNSAFLLKAGVGWGEDMIGFARLKAINNEASYTKDVQNPLIMQDLRLETRFQVSPLLNNHKIISGISVTIGEKENFFGILAVYTTTERLFDLQEIDFLKRVSKILAAIVEREKEQEKLHLLKQAIDSSINGIVISDANDDNNPIIYVNSGFERITGYTKQEILGNNCNFLQRGDKNQAEIQEIKKAVQEGKEIKTILRNYRKDGKMFWNQLHIAPVYNSERILTNFIGVQTDISAQISAELALKEKTQALENFTDNLKTINEIKNTPQPPEDILINYLKTGCEILNMELGILSEIINNHYIINASYSSKFNHILPGSEYQLHNTLCAEVIRNQKTISYTNISKNSQLSKHSIFLNSQLESYIATPIWLHGEIYGTLNFSSSLPKETIPNYQYELIELIAQGIAHTLQVAEVELEKEQINIALKESQERLDSILTSIEDVIWSLHLETLQLLYINPAVEQLYEHNLSSFFQQRCFWLEVIHPSDRPWVKECYASLLNISLLSKNSNNHDLEYRILLPDGSEKYVRDRAHIVYEQNEKPIRVDGIITDISNRKIAEIALQKSEEQFRLIFELAPIGMLITTLDGYIEEVNQALCDILKYKPAELIGQNYTYFTHPDELASDLIFKQKILNNEISNYSKEKRYLAKNGRIVYTLLKVTVLKNSQGEPKQFIKQIVDISERKKIEEQLLHDALHDQLTGLPNRTLFIERLTQTLYRCQKHPEQLCAVLFLDLDHFKKINESLGHEFGDELLIVIAEKIQSCLGFNDTLARFGGDEFTILLDDLKTESEATEIADNILDICSSPISLRDHEIFTSVTIGIAFSSIGYKKPEDMLRDADLTMYQTKDTGRNCYRIFNQAMYSKLVKRVEIESLLRKAIENKEFTLFYQPIISLATGKLTGFEALIRWNSSQKGFISPADFIPITEETGLIVGLGEWVLLQAAKQSVIWHNTFKDLSLTISVNLSGKQLIEANLLDRIDKILETTNVNPRSLKLEVTETILMDNFDYAQHILREIQARNINISLDDFGTGYSSLSYLHILPLNTLKIDRSFVTPIETNPEKSAIVKAIVTLAHNLSLDVIAEGIETQTQADVLKNIGCDYGQGYLYSKPVNTEDAELIIREGIRY